MQLAINDEKKLIASADLQFKNINVGLNLLKIPLLFNAKPAGELTCEAIYGEIENLEEKR